MYIWKYQTPEGFDDIYYPEGMEFVPHKAAIVRANEKAIERSGFLVAYLVHTASNTEKFVEYAKEKDVKILYL